jgi:hypothetical protein
VGGARLTHLFKHTTEFVGIIKEKDKNGNHGGEMEKGWKVKDERKIVNGVVNL